MHDASTLLLTSRPDELRPTVEHAAEALHPGLRRTCFETTRALQIEVEPCTASGHRVRAHLSGETEVTMTVSMRVMSAGDGCGSLKMPRSRGNRSPLDATLATTWRKALLLVAGSARARPR